MRKKGIISCIGTGGLVSDFNYSAELELLSGTWVYRVTGKTEDFFELRVQEISASVWRVVLIDNHGVAELSRKGIAGAVLKKARFEIGDRIESSPKSGIGAWRTDDAEKVWRALVNEGAATYDPEMDVYFLP